MRSSTARRLKSPQPPRQLPETQAPRPLIVAGRGNLGRSLARALRAVGHPVRLVSVRTELPKLVRALELQPDLPEAHLARGYSLYYGDRKYDAALKEFAIA